jgi:SSS family solute:Na+ symporter
VGMLVLKKPSSLAAIVSMILGGSTTLFLIISELKLPYELDANFFGISIATISFVIIQFIKRK